MAMFQKQQEKACSNKQAFPKFLPCHIHKHLLSQSKSHDQAQIPLLDRRVTKSHHKELNHNKSEFIKLSLALFTFLFHLPLFVPIYLGDTFH